jgi:acyl-coenzyme A synthetase/AMP-(fatty) acid ligase
MQPSGPPEYFNHAEDVLGPCAAEFPTRTALLAVDASGHETPWSFGSLHEQSSRLAHVLRARGLRRGDVVLVMVASFSYRVIAQLAVLQAGGVHLLTRYQSPAREVAQYIARARPRLAVAGPEDAERLPAGYPVLVLPSPELDAECRAAPAAFASLQLRSDEPALLELTGGTTGLPKMVLHTHGGRPYHFLRWTVAFAPDDLSWDLSGRWWMGAWRQGTPVFDRALATGARPELVLETLATYPITRLMAPARLYSELVRCDLSAYVFRSLRTCCSGGQALDPTVFRAWKEATGLTIYNRYGQSECGEATTQPPGERAAVPGCIGKAFPWIEMAVIDQAGHPRPTGELGDIAIKVAPVRQPWLFREYCGDPDATAARHRGDWYLTGDLGRRDDAGYFYVVGRADDVINCGATNIGPEELEAVLLEHPAVRETAVVGKPHRDLGEIPKAFVVLEASHAPAAELADALLQHVNQAVHPHKRLQEIEFTAKLPRNPEGKLRRGALREQERTAVGANALQLFSRVGPEQE